MRVDVPVVQLRDAPEGAKRLVELAELLVDLAELVVGVGGIGLMFERVAVLYRRRPRPCLRDVRITRGHERLRAGTRIVSAAAAQENDSDEQTAGASGDSRHGSHRVRCGTSAPAKTWPAPRIFTVSASNGAASCPCHWPSSSGNRESAGNGVIADSGIISNAPEWAGSSRRAGATRGPRSRQAAQAGAGPLQETLKKSASGSHCAPTGRPDSSVADPSLPMYGRQAPLYGRDRGSGIRDPGPGIRSLPSHACPIPDPRSPIPDPGIPSSSTIPMQ